VHGTVNADRGVPIARLWLVFLVVAWRAVVQAEPCPRGRGVAEVLAAHDAARPKCRRVPVALAPGVALGRAITCRDVAALPEATEDVTVAARADILIGTDQWPALRDHLETWSHRSPDAMPLYLLAALATRDRDFAAAVTFLSRADATPIFAPHVRERFAAVKAAAEHDGTSPNLASGVALGELVPFSSYALLFRSCRELLGAVPSEAAEPCRRLGERMEMEGITLIETLMGSRLQQLALTCDGCPRRPDRLADVSSRRARQKGVMRKGTAVDVDEDSPAVPAYFSDLLRVGEEQAAIERIIAARRAPSP
jgi:hypothetical protein